MAAPAQGALGRQAVDAAGSSAAGTAAEGTSGTPVPAPTAAPAMLENGGEGRGASADGGGGGDAAAQGAQGMARRSSQACWSAGAEGLKSWVTHAGG